VHIPVIPLFLSVYVGPILGLIAWGYLHARQSELSDIMFGAYDGVLLGLLLLPAFTTGAFAAHVLLGIE
jgi:hypothetical protein